MRRSWGPFSGRQLTVIIVTAIVAIFVPGTVWAVDTFSNVAIEDPGTGVKAQVDSTHHLKVSDGSGPMTVDGTVTATATETPPAKLTNIFVYGSSSCGSAAYTVPAGKALIIKSVVFYSHNAASGQTELDLYQGPTSSTPCTQFLGAASSDLADETIPEDFGAGVAVPAGHVLTLLGASNDGSAMVYGYFVPASAVPASATPAASGPVSTDSRTRSR